MTSDFALFIRSADKKTQQDNGLPVHATHDGRRVGNIVDFEHQWSVVMVSPIPARNYLPYPVVPYSREEFRGRVERDQQKPRFAKASDRLWSVGALGGTTLTTAGSIIFVIFSVGLTGFLVGSALFVAASLIGFGKAVHNAHKVLWNRQGPNPQSLRLHGFSATGVVEDRREAARLTHWLQANEYIGAKRDRVVLRKPCPDELAARKIRDKFPALSERQLEQIADTLDVVAGLKPKETV